jgi:hypothetical protein
MAGIDAYGSMFHKLANRYKQHDNESNARATAQADMSRAPQCKPAKAQPPSQALTAQRHQQPAQRADPLTSSPRHTLTTNAPIATSSGAHQPSQPSRQTHSRQRTTI